MENSATYYPCHIQWQGRLGVMLWADQPEPAREHLWADSQRRCPIFGSLAQLTAHAEKQSWSLEPTEAAATDLDAVAAWVAGEAARPVAVCLAVWGLLDDLSAGTGCAFLGNQKSELRNEVFDLLYAESGLWQLPTELVQWEPMQLNKLREILVQGLNLWEQRTYWL